jgi:hypothetical protein
MDAKGGAEAGGRLTAMDEVDAGDLLITFDGRVLELFNTMDGTSKRYHVRRFALTLEGPDDKGRLPRLHQAQGGQWRERLPRRWG